MKSLPCFIFLLAVPMLLSGCSGYSFDINKNQVYTPPSIYTDFTLADQSLQSCISQTIKDQNITSPAKLTVLTCSFSGIANLEGLSQFSRLEHISLKGNDIRQVDELLMLTHLRHLDLSDNPISSCASLSQLEKLVIETLAHNSAC